MTGRRWLEVGDIVRDLELGETGVVVSTSNPFRPVVQFEGWAGEIPREGLELVEPHPTPRLVARVLLDSLTLGAGYDADRGEVYVHLFVWRLSIVVGAPRVVRWRPVESIFLGGAPFVLVGRGGGDPRVELISRGALVGRQPWGEGYTQWVPVDFPEE